MCSYPILRSVLRFIGASADAAENGSNEPKARYVLTAHPIYPLDKLYTFKCSLLF